MQLAYAILLPDQLANRVRRARFLVAERYGAGARDLLTEPHITLKAPFETDRVEPHSAYLHRLAAATEPFEIVVGSPALFEDPWVLFYDVAQDERLHALQRRILADLAVEPRDHEASGWHFHVTVAGTLDEPQARAARDELDDGAEFRFQLERLALWRQVEDARCWTIYEVAQTRH